MAVYIDLKSQHHVVYAQAHFYEQPTSPLYLDRTLIYHDLIYLEKGQWLFTENDTDYLLEKDSVLLLAAKHHHYTRLPCQAGTRTMCIHITADPGDVEGTGVALPTLFTASKSSKVHSLFRQLVSLFWSDDQFKNEKMDSYLSLLLIECAADRTNFSQDNLVSEIVRMISENPHTSYRLSDMAEHFKVSGKTIEAAMKTGVGMPFSKYQMTRKLEMAAKQLTTEPDVHLHEVAQTLGFSDEFHLSRAFKTKFGISPAEYRKQKIKNN